MSTVGSELSIWFLFGPPRKQTCQRLSTVCAIFFLLESYTSKGVSESYLDWIHSYLTDRNQRVKMCSERLVRLLLLQGFRKDYILAPIISFTYQ